MQLGVGDFGSRPAEDVASGDPLLQLAWIGEVVSHPQKRSS
jgi:hypothetical protein